MRADSTPLEGVMTLEPKVFGDQRGLFFESFNSRNFEVLTGVRTDFVQDNHSRSERNVLRGLHYQICQPQGKLVRVVSGAVFDVAVDLRQSSSSFGKWYGLTLSAENKQQLWIPPGFAHGFLVLSETADFLYKTTDYWSPEYECCIRWDDPDLGIEWPVIAEPKISSKDAQGLAFRDASVFS